MTTEARLARLERDRRWMALLLLAALVAIGALWLRPPATPPADVQSHAAQPIDATPPVPTTTEGVAPEPVPSEAPGVVRGTAFVLVDAEGRTRAELKVGRGADCVLAFQDKEETPRAVFGILDGGSAGYELMDGTGRKWVDMAVYHKDGATLIFEDEVVERQLYFGLWGEDITRMTFGRKGKAILDFWDDEDGMHVTADSVRTPWNDD